MPRPRLLPSQRRRAAEACNFCRDAKKKCSGTAPCTHCLRRGIGAQCTITLRRRGSRGAHSGDAPSHDEAESQPSASKAPSRNESGIGSNRVNHRGSSIYNGTEAAESTSKDTGNATFRPLSPSDSRLGLSMPESSDEPRRHRTSDASSVSGNPHSRMLLNLRGERGIAYSRFCAPSHPAVSLTLKCSVYWRCCISVIPTNSSSNRGGTDWAISVLP